MHRYIYIIYIYARAVQAQSELRGTDMFTVVINLGWLTQGPLIPRRHLGSNPSHWHRRRIMISIPWYSKTSIMINNNNNTVSQIRSRVINERSMKDVIRLLSDPGMGRKLQA